jgi:hypothetical protein
MNCIAEYRILLGDECVSDRDFDAIRDITIEQTVDMIWEARIRMSIGSDEKGIWNIHDKDFAKLHSRARIEIKRDNSFVCLIDGPIVTIQVDMVSEPGQSSITLVIYDDSVLLDNDEDIFLYENKRGVEIAEEIYGDARTTGILDSFEIIDEVTPTKPKTITFRGTRMGLLRHLARENLVHAYVLPGNLGKKSMGFFNAHPKDPQVFTDFFLVGENRNIERLNIMANALQPTKVKVSSLDVKSKKISPGTYLDNEQFSLLGDLPVIHSNEFGSVNMINPSSQLFHPNTSFSSDIEQVIKDQVNKSWYAVEATGQLLVTSNYGDILSPYGFVTVNGLNPIYCGKYFITKVTHTITPMNYTQSFTMIRNAFSDPSKTCSNMEIIT